MTDPDRMSPLLDRFSYQLGQLTACQEELRELIEESLDHIGRLKGYVVVPTDRNTSAVGPFEYETDAATYGLERDIGFDIRWVEAPEAD